jgi:hypothetical protein
MLSGDGTWVYSQGGTAQSNLGAPFELETAVQLATGLWGWYRSTVNTIITADPLRQETQLLFPPKHFSMIGIRFSATSMAVYMVQRSTRVALLSGWLCHEHPALSDDAGVDCLRALIVGLLLHGGGTNLCPPKRPDPTAFTSLPA